MNDTKGSSGIKQKQTHKLHITTEDDMHASGGGSGRNNTPDGVDGTKRPNSSLNMAASTVHLSKSGGGANGSNMSSNDKERLIDEKLLSSRDQEKREALAKQRENYLNSASTSGLEGDILLQPGARNAGRLRRFRLFLKNIFSDIDSHTEHLFYVIAAEMFFIFLTYTHYSYLDNKNRFLTPIVMGSETSLLGQTLTQLFDWTRARTALRNRTVHKTPSDEEMNLTSATNGTSNSMSTGMREMHSRNSSSNTIPVSVSPHLAPVSGNSAVSGQPLEQMHIHNPLPRTMLAADKEASLRDHLKFLIWGGVNGLLCSYWIELLLTVFRDRELVCVLVDQTAGTVIFQTLYSLYICLWDGEVEVSGAAAIADTSDSSRRTVELTWENFTNHYAGMLWKYMKLSYLVWPVISLLCFTVLSDEWIFPVNCFFATLFGVTLGM
ncbi:hypothetical protein PICMEDRAFT_74362 [Pichia membranifaciens NRRL Y-2026]|uniref:Uncharacterized protein n=1 Tax=Pichia membranifaciens NRRL Y-2026 TaxID=763406 RepID=A0A1E3NEU1_9ASCO|nr:hypothetical protein PICMEDRAFT_74362 [Pichia membranifaciens NRRL Y-2026]ODQ44651.1 hypothetical protein PICMEDRAFT_74362 [Pichia membranifaciens NRRL Y-2026]